MNFKRKRVALAALFYFKYFYKSLKYVKKPYLLSEKAMVSDEYHKYFTFFKKDYSPGNIFLNPKMVKVN